MWGWNCGIRTDVIIVETEKDTGRSQTSREISSTAEKLLDSQKRPSPMDLFIFLSWSCTVKVKWPRYRPGVAQRVGRGIALLFHNRGARRGWVVSSTPRPHFTPGKDPVPILQKTGWAPGPVWMGGKSRPHRDSIPDRPARSSVAIPTELPGPHHEHVNCLKTCPQASSKASSPQSAL